MQNQTLVSLPIKKLSVFLKLFFSAALCAAATLQIFARNQAQIVAIVGGTIIDTADFGKSTDDIKNSVVVITDGKIISVGKKGAVKIPKNAQVIDASGKFIIPGLIDGFAGMNSQAQANAYLYSGVTSIVAGTDPRRGRLFEAAAPSPRIYKSAIAGYRGGIADKTLLSEAETLKQLDEFARAGVKVVLIHHGIPADLMRVIARRARELGIATIGEVAAATYPQAVEAGIHSFVHTMRYSAELLPAEQRATYAAEKGNIPPLNVFLAKYDTTDKQLEKYAALFANSKIALIPTLSMVYLDLPEPANLWREPAAKILDPRGIHLPADTETGRRKPVFPAGLAENILKIEERYRRAGARYLTGSAASAFGTMPGVSLHTELELLTRIGLTPREALAAATSNFEAIYGWRDVGSVKPGYQADLLILDENPLDNIANAKEINRLIFKEEIISREKLLEINSPPR